MSDRIERFKLIPPNKVVFKEKSKISKLYKEGYSLSFLSRYFHFDFSVILHNVRKIRLKRKALYRIYEKQAERKEFSRPEKILENEKTYLDKYFPDTNTEDISNSYYWYWKDKFDKAEELKRNCKHETKHVRCGACNKILFDASNIENPHEKMTIIKMNDENEYQIN